MGVRTGRRLELTVAVPLVDRHVESELQYFRKKERLREELLDHLRSGAETLSDLSVTLNALDRAGRGLAGMYLSVLGTSAEHGDSGQVGRGNAVNGLISLMRPQGAEAAAGKNPVSHVGKIYGLFADRLAGALYASVAGLRGTTVWMASRIGEPIDRPWIVSVHLHPGSGFDEAAARAEAGALVRREIETIPAFTRELVGGRIPVC
jgi:S-adenosylmethionine synthetase